MAAKLAGGFITSNQTGAYQRVPVNGNTYICVFYVYDASFTKGITIQCRHNTQMVLAKRLQAKDTPYGQQNVVLYQKLANNDPIYSARQTLHTSRESH